MNVDRDGMKLEQRAELIERHAPARQDVARKHGVRGRVEHVVLGEGAVGRIGGRRRRWDLQRVESHHHAGDAAIALGCLRDEVDRERKIVFERLALKQKPLAVLRGEIRQPRGERQGFGQRAGRGEAEREQEPSQSANRHYGAHAGPLYPSDVVLGTEATVRAK